MSLLADTVGFEIDFISGPSWNDFMKMIQNKELDVILIKPVSPSMLFDTIIEAFGKSSGIVKRSKGEDEKPEGFDKILGARVLLAEDNEINQQAAVEMIR